MYSDWACREIIFAESFIALTTSCLQSVIALYTEENNTESRDTTRLSQFHLPSMISRFSQLQPVFSEAGERIIVGGALINLILLFMILINLNACIE